jgi:predicted TIM-barrel enzyme
MADQQPAEPPGMEDPGAGPVAEPGTEPAEAPGEAAADPLLACALVGMGITSLSMAAAGADVLVPHVGLTTKGTIGASTALTLDQAVERVQTMRDAAVAVNPDILVLCHGGPIAEPAAAGYVLERTEGVAGFFGASSVERLPTERAITAQVAELKNLLPMSVD